MNMDERHRFASWVSLPVSITSYRPARAGALALNPTAHGFLVPVNHLECVLLRVSQGHIQCPWKNQPSFMLSLRPTRFPTNVVPDFFTWEKGPSNFHNVEGYTSFYSKAQRNHNYHFSSSPIFQLFETEFK